MKERKFCGGMLPRHLSGGILPPENAAPQRFLREYHPLPDFLSLAVPFNVLNLKRRGGPTDCELDSAREFGIELASKGDSLLFTTKTKGETAKVFNELARAIAIASFLPGGIEVFGTTFKANMKPDIKLGYYKHFKGAVYRVYGIAQSCDDGDKWVVVYGNAHGYYYRAPERFLEQVNHEGKTVARYEFLEEVID